MVRDGEGRHDSTMALYGSGLSYGNSHGTSALPLVVAGGSGLGMKHGNHVVQPAGQGFGGYVRASKPPQPSECNAHFSNLPLTMAQKMGWN